MNITEDVEENLLADDISTIISTLERSLNNEVVQNDKVNHQPCTGPYLFTVRMYTCLAGIGHARKEGSLPHIMF